MHVSITALYKSEEESVACTKHDLLVLYDSLRHGLGVRADANVRHIGGQLHLKLNNFQTYYASQRKITR